MSHATAILSVAPAARPYLRALVDQMQEARILANPRRAAAFLGQVHAESMGFKRVQESMAYRPARLLAIFKGRNGLDTLAEAEALVKRGPDAIANHVYGGEWGARKLGNTQPGDGARFIGRGLKQLTGRDNYTRFSKAWQGDLSVLQHPERVAQPDGAVASAIWYWSSRKPQGIEAHADAFDIAEVTRLVNGGLIGLAERKQWSVAYFTALQGL